MLAVRRANVFSVEKWHYPRHRTYLKKKRKNSIAIQIVSIGIHDQWLRWITIIFWQVGETMAQASQKLNTNLFQASEMFHFRWANCVITFARKYVCVWTNPKVMTATQKYSLIVSFFPNRFLPVGTSKIRVKNCLMRQTTYKRSWISQIRKQNLELWGQNQETRGISGSQTTGRCHVRSVLNYLKVITLCLPLANLAFNFLLILLTLPINPLFMPILEFILRFNRGSIFLNSWNTNSLRYCF